MHSNFHEFFFFCILWFIHLSLLKKCCVNICIPIATRLPWLQTHQRQCLITVQLFLNYIKHHRFITNLLTIHIFHAFYQLLLWKHVYIAFLKNKVIAQLPWKQVSGIFFRIVQHVSQHHASQFVSFCLFLHHLSLIEMMFLPF